MEKKTEGHKKFDCVAMTRKIREELSLRYFGNSEKMFKEFKEFREQLKIEYPELFKDKEIIENE